MCQELKYTACAVGWAKASALREPCPRAALVRVGTARAASGAPRLCPPYDPRQLAAASIDGAPSGPMDSSALAPLLLLGKPEPAVSLRKKYFLELREARFLGELETSRSVLSGLLSGRVVRHRVIQSGSDAIWPSHRDMLAGSGSTPAIHRIELKERFRQRSRGRAGRRGHFSPGKACVGRIRRAVYNV
jgi:hypothetical protein